MVTLFPVISYHLTLVPQRPWVVICVWSFPCTLLNFRCKVLALSSLNDKAVSSSTYVLLPHKCNFRSWINSRALAASP